MTMRLTPYLRFIWGRKIGDLGKFNLIEPGQVSLPRTIPDHIIKPSYYDSGIINPGPVEPEIKSQDQIEKLSRSCQLACLLLHKVGDIIKEGVTTDDIDAFVHEECINNGAYPSPLHYRGFPKSVCTSVNNVACHGIPDDRSLANGDIVNVDITVYLDNYHGDCSKTFLIGDVDEHGKYLVNITEECLKKGILACGPGVPFSEIGFVIHKHATRHGLSVVPAFLGHGIGEYFHGPPDIYHARNNYPGVMLAGMTFTIEPVLSLGGEMVELLEDGWTAVTEDNARTAQVEHTICITEDGCRVLTELENL